LAGPAPGQALLREKEVVMAKREKIGTGANSRYVRRDDQGRFTEDQVDVGKSLAADQRQHAEHEAKPGQGDRGDRKPEEKR
jgi:hypothetical protein